MTFIDNMSRITTGMRLDRVKRGVKEVQRGIVWLDDDIEDIETRTRKLLQFLEVLDRAGLSLDDYHRMQHACDHSRPDPQR